MARIQIPVSVLEFDTDGNTIWIQNTEGFTCMRIKTTGKILTEQCSNSPVSHSDIIVKENINIYLSEDATLTLY